MSDLIHFHAVGELLTACELDPDTDPEEWNPKNWVHTTADPNQATCSTCLASFPLRLGTSHADIVYRQLGPEPAKTDPRVAVFMGGDAETMAAAYVALVNGGGRG